MSTLFCKLNILAIFDDVFNLNQAYLIVSSFSLYKKTNNWLNICKKKYARSVEIQYIKHFDQYI